MPNNSASFEPPRQKRKHLHPDIRALLAFADGESATGFPGDLWGQAARACVIPLLQDWQLTLAQDRPAEGVGPQNLVADIDLCIQHLLAFKKEALSRLPAQHGGLKQAEGPQA